MRRLPLLALIVVGLVVGGVALASALTSDEERIRERLADLVTDFNERSALSLSGGYTADFVDETTGADRSLLRQLVLVLDQRRSSYRTELVPDALVIEVEDGADTAAAVFDARLLDGDRSVWEVKIHAELRREGGAWLIARSRHETLAGRRPTR